MRLRLEAAKRILQQTRQDRIEDKFGLRLAELDKLSDEHFPNGIYEPELDSGIPEISFSELPSSPEELAEHLERAREAAKIITKAHLARSLRLEYEMTWFEDVSLSVNNLCDYVKYAQYGLFSRTPILLDPKAEAFLVEGVGYEWNWNLNLPDRWLSLRMDELYNELGCWLMKCVKFSLDRTREITNRLEWGLLFRIIKDMEIEKYQRGSQL